ncbi:MAG: hypothetical protein ACTSRP_18955 [Candidatus Helarchaeota archaeon]
MIDFYLYIYQIISACLPSILTLIFNFFISRNYPKIDIKISNSEILQCMCKFFNKYEIKKLINSIENIEDLKNGLWSNFLGICITGIIISFNIFIALFIKYISLLIFSSINALLLIFLIIFIIIWILLWINYLPNKIFTNINNRIDSISEINIINVYLNNKDDGNDNNISVIKEFIKKKFGHSNFKILKYIPIYKFNKYAPLINLLLISLSTYIIIIL